MNSRPSSENPVGLIDWGFGWVPKHGFAWVQGRSGLSGIQHLFLIPKSTTVSIHDIPQDLYLQFAELKQTRDAVLDFAKRYGSLGLVKRHFHSPQTKTEYGEAFGDWCNEIEQLRICFEGWQLAQGNDAVKLTQFMAKNKWPIGDPTDSPFLIARSMVLSNINGKMNPLRVPHERCSHKNCQHNSALAKVTAYVVYQLNFVHRNGVLTPNYAVESRIVPTALLSAVWLQFAELVTGARVVRRCEKCKEWMDITECPRKGSKRLHERCSLALRMSRYRQKKKLAS